VGVGVDALNRRRLCLQNVLVQKVYAVVKAHRRFSGIEGVQDSNGERLPHLRGDFVCGPLASVFR
jgi:hypothetical protein